MNRAFSQLQIRSIREDERLIEGWATTPQPDRMDDVVEPRGALFKLPIPLLLDHNHAEAVGEVESAEVTAQGIRFIARVKKISEPGAAKDLVDRGWSLIKNGLRRSVSIGFRPLKQERIEGGGYRFTSWEWLELSAVSVPAQPGATITGVKAYRRPGVVKVTLSPREIIMGKNLAAAAERAKVRERLGITALPVRLPAREEALLAEGELLLRRLERRSAR